MAPTNPPIIATDPPGNKQFDVYVYVADTLYIYQTTILSHNLNNNIDIILTAQIAPNIFAKKNTFYKGKIFLNATKQTSSRSKTVTSLSLKLCCDMPKSNVSLPILSVLLYGCRRHYTLNYIKLIFGISFNARP